MADPVRLHDVGQRNTNERARMRARIRELEALVERRPDHEGGGAGLEQELRFRVAARRLGAAEAELASAFTEAERAIAAAEAAEADAARTGAGKKEADAAKAAREAAEKAIAAADRARDEAEVRRQELEAAGGGGAAAKSMSTGTSGLAYPVPEFEDAEQELAWLRDHVDDQVVDPVFLAVSVDLSDDPDDPVLHEDGVFPSQAAKSRRPGKLTEEEQRIAAVFGILVRDNKVQVQLGRRFSDAMSRARGEYKADVPLFRVVFDEVVEELSGKRGVRDEVRASDWAAVVKTLRERGARADDLYTRVQARVALNNLTGGDTAQPPSSVDIDLPDLEDEVDIEIVEANLHAMQAIYYAAMLEELRLFQVADKLVELFNAGLLPLGKGPAGDLLFDYWKKSTDRFTEVERLNLYARSFGFPVGEPLASATPNREFENLWLRFLSALSSFFRQHQLEDLFTSSIPNRVSQEQVRKSGRDLAANLSLYGYGVAYFAAIDLQQQIRDILALLSADEVKAATGARDAMQVAEYISATELGGAKSSVRYRTMATSGAIIIRWLANHASELASVGYPIIDPASIKGVKSRAPMKNPTTADLLGAAESWLAVAGIPDIQVEEYAQPVEAPNFTSRPIQLPAVARDALSGAGLNPDGVLAG